MVASNQGQQLDLLNMSTTTTSFSTSSTSSSMFGLADNLNPTMETTPSNQLNQNPLCIYIDHNIPTSQTIASDSKPIFVKKLRKNTGGVIHPFPELLMNLLNVEEEAITWLCHGRAFTILDHEKFVSSVMPKHFKQQGGEKGKMTSFQRQLNLYCFKSYTDYDGEFYILS